MDHKPKIVTDFDTVRRFRDILYLELIMPPSLGILSYPIHYLLMYLFNDPLINIKILLILLATAAVLFTPYIIYVLIKEKHYGWIITFFSMVIFPLVAGYFIFKDTLAFEASILIPLGLFYLYCYLLKFDVNKWIKDYNWNMQLLEQRREKEENLQNYFL